MFPIIGEVVIRTNGGSLTVSDKGTSGSVTHYGMLDKALVTTDMNCFVTHGTISYMKLTDGKAIADENGIIYLMEAETETAAAEERGGVIIIPASATTAEIKTPAHNLPEGYVVTETGTTQPADIATKIATNQGLLGSGTENDPFQIYDCTTYNAINFFKDASESFYFKVNIEMTNNGVIDLLGTDPKIYLNGSFDGCGVTFSNMKGTNGLIFEIKSNDNAPVIVKNFVVSESVRVEKQYGAAIIRQIETDNVTIDGITSRARIFATGGHGSGLIGYTNNSSRKCRNLSIKNCVINTILTNTSNEPLGTFVGYAQVYGDGLYDYTYVNIENCTFGGHASTKKTFDKYLAQKPSITDPSKGWNRNSANYIHLTVDGVNLDCTTAQSMDSSYVSSMTTCTIQETDDGYKFNAVANATEAEITFEIRGKLGELRGYNFTVVTNTQSISAGENTISAFGKISAVTQDSTKDVSESSYDASTKTYNICNNNYDPDYLSLPLIYVIQKDAAGNILAIGSLSISPSGLAD